MMQRFYEERPTAKPTVGRVLLAANQKLHICGAADTNDPGFCAPYGYFAYPTEQTAVLLQETDEHKWVMLGCLGNVEDLQPGEVLLRSAGGAYLKLCADGTARLNGLVVGSDGTIQTP